MSGYWKTVIDYNEATGQKRSYQIWIDTTAQTEAVRAAARRRAQRRAAAARRRAAAAARAAAERARQRALGEANERAALQRQQAEARRIQQQRVVEARRASYEALKTRQAELLRNRGIVPADKYVAERDDMLREKAEIRRIQAENQRVAQAKQAAITQADRNAYWQKRLLMMKLTGQYVGPHGSGTKVAPGQLDDGDIKALENVLRYETERAKKGQFDTATVEKLREAYDKHAEKVYDAYEQLVVQINSAIDKGNIETARALYEQYKKLVPEFQRLFGTGRDALKDGAYNQFYEQYQQIGLAQRDWWKSQMKASLEQTIRNAQSDDRPGREPADVSEAQELLDILNGKTKTRKIDGPGRPRYFTIEEELAARQAEKIMQMEKLRAQWGLQQHRIRVQMMKEGMVEYKGQYIDKGQLPVVRQAEDVMNRFYGGKFDPQRPNDIHTFVDKMLGEWEKTHPKPKVPAGARYGGPQLAAQLELWNRQRQAYENSAYQFFGLGPQGILEKGMDAPGIRHALQLLQGPFSAIGAGARALNAAAFGNTKIGGINPTYLDAPAYLKQQMEAAAQQWVRDEGQRLFGGGTTAATRWDPRAGMEQAKQRFFEQWLQTAQGRIWLQSTLTRRTQEQAQQGRDFSEGFYGKEGDFWSRLEALNKFGASPFQNEGANLLASLLLDPLNAIPLNFTKYGARGLYALEQTKGLGKVSRPLTAAKTFLSVDEGTLSAWKHFRGIEKELAAKGMSRDRFLDLVRERVQGIKSASDQAKAIRQLFRELGIEGRKVNESQLANLAEQMIEATARQRKLDLYTQADELADNMKKAERVAAEKERARAALSKAEQERVAQSLRARESETKMARAAEKTRKAAVEQNLTKKAAVERARQAGAAKEVAGPPSPVRTVEPHPVARQVRARVPRAHERPYAAVDEYYVSDALGNRLPKGSTLARQADYQQMVQKAQEGDPVARVEVARLARRERNRVRMESQDFAILDPKARTAWRPTSYDVGEAAGVNADSATELARLNIERRTLRQLRLAASQKADDWVKTFTRPEGGKFRFTEADETMVESEMERFFQLDAIAPSDRRLIGQDILNAREESVRGLHGAYEPFSHKNMEYYPASWQAGVSPEAVAGLTPEKLVARLQKSPQTGLADFRDFGQYFFEVFHQLRLANQMETLAGMSKAVDGLLATDPDNLFAWMWKVMEDRTNLLDDYLWSVDDVARGFLDAAETAGLHSELALAMIPWGYVAKSPPLSFGLTPKLAAAAETAPWFESAPANWTESIAKNEISKIAMGGNGSATKVVHYFAEKYGDFVKAGSGYARMMDELAWASAVQMGDDFVDAVLRQADQLDRDLFDFARRRNQPIETFLRREIEDQLAKFPPGSRSLARNPEFRGYRKAIQQAYSKGLLPVKNPEFHKLMLLARLQTEVGHGAANQAIRTYSMYMRQIGKRPEAKRIISDLFEGDIVTDATRLARERAGQTGPVTLDARAQLWNDLGLMPSAAKMKAYAEGRAKSQGALEAQIARELKRGEWLDEHAPLHRDAYVGSVDMSDTVANLRDIMADFGKTGAPELLDEAVGQLRSVVYRMVDKGGAGVSMESLDELGAVVDTLRGMPHADALLSKLDDELGAMVQGERMKISAQPLALERAVQSLKVKSLTGVKGKETALREAEEQMARLDRAVAEMGGPKVEVTLTNKDGVDHKVLISPRQRVEIPDSMGEATVSPVSVTPPVASAPLSASEALLERISKMTEQQWYDYAKAEVKARLARKNLSAAYRKAQAKRLRQIEAAELGLRVEKGQGTLIHWKHRGSFQKRVLRLFGKDAEEYIAPKMVAPFITDASAAVVEQARTYFRLLKVSSGADVPGVGAIKVAGENVDHMPLDVFRSLDERMSAAIREARGYMANTRTRRRSGGSALESDKPLGRMTDRDPVVLRAKERVLREYHKATGIFVPMAAYDEARKVLWKGHVQNRTALQLLDRAQRRAAVGLGGTDVEAIYLSLRSRLAKAEARRQLGGMAFGEMYGVDPNVIFAEFVARYSDDGTIRKFTPELTGFQRRTLEAQFKELSGVASTDPLAGAFLQSANRPPLHNREMTREFLKRTGAWSPRKAEDFIAGKRSWSVWEEAEYWRTTYGEVPEWADVSLLADLDNGVGMIFHDHAMYIDQMKAWGVFDRSQELALRIDGKTMAEIEEAILKGDPQLGLPARRALELQRKFAIERYGKLVSQDGRTLDAMPWLMHPDELRRYFSRRSIKGLPEGLIQSERELLEVEALIQKAIDRFWDRYIDVKAADGPVHYHDVFRLASEVQAALLANPKWARRYRDVFGKALDSWAWVNRWFVFSNPSFAVMNMVDVPIKGSWYRFTRRGLFNRTLENSKYAARAETLTPQMFNWDATPAMYRTKQLTARQRVAAPRGLTATERAVDRALASVQLTGEIFPEIAGRAEQAMKLRLAKGMYPEVYSMALKRLGDPEIAHAAALDFIKKEVSRLWPTAGDGPIEQLWNRIAPFASYTLRNKMVWISEAIDHPVVLVHFERIGAYIERHNMREWEREHPGQPMPEQLRRLIELPWAKGYYIDLSQFTDASRGLKPLYDTDWKSNLDRLHDWIRVVSPTTQAGFYAVFNAFNLFPRTAWQLGEDGRYHLVTVPWLEPWSQDAATPSSVLWWLDAVEVGKKYGINGWNSGEVSAILGQVFLFNAVKTYDKMAVLYGWYKGLSSEDRKTFRATDEGHVLMEWLATRARISDFKGDLLTMMAEHDKDPGRWWFLHQPDEWKDRVYAGRDKIRAIREAFASELYMLTPGTKEYREMKARMYLAISDVYTEYPELMESEVYSKSASEWAEQMAEWQTDKLMDDFMALSRQRPQRSQFSSTVAYNKAVEDWERQKRIFLTTFPQVRDRLAGEIVEVESVRDKIERQWDTVLSRIAKRNEAIDAAKAILREHGRDSKTGRQAQARLDLLYLQNDLDYSLLERDYAATYFAPDDFKRLPDGTLGELRVPGLLKRATTFMDFDRAVYEKHRKAGTLEEYLAKAMYGQAMRAAMLAAKGGDPFGKFDPAKWLKYMQDHPSLLEGYFQNNPEKKMEWATAARYVEGIRALWKQAGNDPAKWVRLLKQDKWLLNQYFSRNPGKEKEWARTDAYIRYISVWGKMVGANRWDEANEVWNTLPAWVKEEYYSRHPERRKRAQQTAEYMGYMDRWVNLFDAGKDAEAMQYFRSLPKWAQERYYKAHPENRLRFESKEKLNQQLRDYFATEKPYRADYLAKNPAFKRWLAQNADTKELERLAILQAYRTIPKGEAWLRKVFRERYPEVFSAEALGERKLKTVYNTLTKHSGLLPEFEKWVETIWKTYDEMLRLGTPRPAKLYFERDRDEERRRRGLAASRSAAEVSAT